MSFSQIKLDARSYLDDKGSKLQCTDFKGSVYVLHQDDTELRFENAILEEKQFGGWNLLLVWTEHCGYFFFFTDDLESWYYEEYEKAETKEWTESSGDMPKC